MIFDALLNNMFLCSSLGWGTKKFVTVKNYMFLTGNFHSCTSKLVNKGFLFATSSRKIKNDVVESQVTLNVWPCLLLTEKQRTINHMIIFNDSISKLYQCSIWGRWKFSKGRGGVKEIFGWWGGELDSRSLPLPPSRENPAASAKNVQMQLNS